MTAQGQHRPHFRTTERFDENGTLCLALVGELDLAAADALAARLHQIEVQEEQVRLDLAKLEFIDSCGIRVLIRAVEGSRRNGSRLTISHRVTPAVGRVIDLVGIGGLFWPDGG